MLSRLRSLLSGGAAAPGEAARESPVPLAAAALLAEAGMMDGSMGVSERARILDILQRRFTLSAAEAEELLAEAEAAVHQATQLLPFTRLVKDSFDHDQRIELIEMLWEVAYADGQLHDYEANLVRRICGLIYVSDQESGMARRRAMARLGLAG